MDELHKIDDLVVVSECFGVQHFADNAHTEQIRAEDTLSMDTAQHLAAVTELIGKPPPDDYMAQFDVNTFLLPLELGGFKLTESVLEDRKVVGEEHSTLQTLAERRSDKAKRAAELSYRQAAYSLMKYRRTDPMGMQPASVPLSSLPLEHRVSPSDVIMTMVVARPFNKVLDYQTIRLGRLLSMDTCMHVLGSSLLSDVHKAIVCTGKYTEHNNNRVTVTKWPHDKFPVKHSSEKQDEQGSFFYIDGILYGHGGQNDALDMIQPIVDWGGQKQRWGSSLAEMVQARMSDTRVSGLFVRMGYPYLYRHATTCDHLIMFTDLRMVNADDCQDVRQYPLHVAHKTLNRGRCACCQTFTASFVCVSHESVPETPCFFCAECMDEFNYNAAGKPIHEFTAFKYVDRSAIP